MEDQHENDCPRPDEEESQEPAFRWAWEEYPFPLSGHGALMLHIGIEEYMRGTRGMYETKMPDHEDAHYCLLRTDSAMIEATKLRDWQAQRESRSVDWENDLLKELASEKDRFKALADAEHQG
jgi:hypothetical protein